MRADFYSALVTAAFVLSHLFVLLTITTVADLTLFIFPFSFPSFCLVCVFLLLPTLFHDFGDAFVSLVCFLGGVGCFSPC